MPAARLPRAAPSLRRRHARSARPPPRRAAGFTAQLCRYHQNVYGGGSLGSPYVDCQSLVTTPAAHIGPVPSVVELDLAGLFYALWSPNAAVVEGAVKLMLTPSEDALWGMSQLVNASTPVAYAANASAF